MSSHRRWLKATRARVAAALEGREEPPEQEPFAEAWIAYAFHLSMREDPEAPVPLEKIIEYADGINKAMPSQNELAWALVRIKRRGWLHAQGATFALTKEARTKIEDVTGAFGGVIDPCERLQEWLVAHPI